MTAPPPQQTCEGLPPLSEHMPSSACLFAVQPGDMCECCAPAHLSLAPCAPLNDHGVNSFCCFLSVPSLACNNHPIHSFHLHPLNLPNY